MSAPFPKQSKTDHASMEVEPELLLEPDSDNADSLVSSNDPDDMANEQTWPTEEEMQGAPPSSEFPHHSIPDATKGTTPKVVKKIPKGMSEYQAAWIIDETDDEDDEGKDEKADEEGMEEDNEKMLEIPAKDDDTEMGADGRKTVAFQELDDDEEDRQ